MSYLATCIFFLFIIIEPRFGDGIDSGIALTPFPSNILDGTRFELTTFYCKIVIGDFVRSKVVTCPSNMKNKTKKRLSGFDVIYLEGVN